MSDNSSYYFTTTTPYSNYYETDDLISFSLAAGSTGVLQFTSLLTTTNTDISVNLVISGGGGGGASSGQSYDSDIETMSWGSGSGGGGAGFGQIVLQDISSTYNYTVGSGGVGGIGSPPPSLAGVDGANGGNSSLTTPYGNIIATGGGGAPSLWTVYGPPPQAGTSGHLTYPSSSNIIVIYDCSGGNGGIGVNNDSSPGTPSAGSDSTPIQTIEIYDSSNVSFGGGGGGGDASTSPQWDSGTSSWIQPQTSNNGGQAGLNGIGGAIGSSGTLTNKDGGNATSYGSGGGGAGQAGITDASFSSEWNYWYNNGGSGGDGVIFITFFKPPVIVSITNGSLVYLNNSTISLQQDSLISLTTNLIGTATSFTQSTSLTFVDVSNNGTITINTSSVDVGNYIFTFYGENNVGISDNFILNISVYAPPTPPPPPPNQVKTGGPIRMCDTRFQGCRHYNKSLPGSSGNIVITGSTQSEILTRLVNLQQYQRGARWVQINAPTNQYGSRAGAPHGYGQSPKNDFN